MSPRLLRAFVSAYGTERGGEATAEALAYAWEHWRRIRRMENPAGYLFRVGQTRTRRRKEGTEALRWKARGVGAERHVEPALTSLLASLSEAQRVSVVLLYGYEWTLREVAELLDVTISTVQTHAERGLAKLRSGLEVSEND
ncbi:MAG: sigma-70 family RNA polymerase sigma factor [Actinomycetota bacterium]|nr:sigma-70 family RNA polymerase sigma factor [Actinomycetota bacterium]